MTPSISELAGRFAQDALELPKERPQTSKSGHVRDFLDHAVGRLELLASPQESDPNEKSMERPAASLDQQQIEMVLAQMATPRRMGETKFRIPKFLFKNPRKAPQAT